MRKLKYLALSPAALLMSQCGQSCTPGPAAPIKEACPPGEVVVWGEDPTPCDLIGGQNTLTILGITEAECNHFGGRWEYEACVDTDF